MFFSNLSNLSNLALTTTALTTTTHTRDARSIDRLRGRAVLTVDKWLRFEMPVASAVLMQLLRYRLQAAFAFKASHARVALPSELAEAVRLVGNAFMYDSRRYSANGASLFPSFATNGSAGRGGGGGGGRGWTEAAETEAVEVGEEGEGEEGERPQQHARLELRGS